MIRFDRTTISIVSVCRCGWRQLTRSQEAADRTSLEHLDIAHRDPDDAPAVERFQASARQRLHRRRRAEILA